MRPELLYKEGHARVLIRQIHGTRWVMGEVAILHSEGLRKSNALTEGAFSGSMLLVFFIARHIVRRGEFTPFMEFPFSFECRHCGGAGFHLLSHADISHGIKLRFSCVANCLESFVMIDGTVILPPVINKSIRKFGAVELVMKSLSKGHSMWRHFENLRFSGYPRGYMLPQHILAYGASTMESAPVIGKDSKVEILLRRFLEPYPYISWLRESLFLSLVNTEPLKNANLETLHWFSDQGLFILPDGAITPGGLEIRFVGFCILEEGIHWRGDSSSFYACFERRLLLWTCFGEDGLTFLADIPLVGCWDDIKCPSDYLADDRALFHYLVNLVLSANMVMTRHPEWCASDPVKRGLSTRERLRQKKVRQNGQGDEDRLVIRYKNFEGFSYGYQPKQAVARFHYQPRPLDIPEAARVHDYIYGGAVGLPFEYPINLVSVLWLRSF